MPPRTMDARHAGMGVQGWFTSLPPITRTLALLMIVFTVAANWGWLSLRSIALMWGPIIKKFEIWRLVTNNFFVGKLSLNFLIQMIWVIQHGCPLESQTFGAEPADYLWMLCIFCGLFVAAAPITGFFFHGPCLIMAIIYVWSRNFSDATVSLYGMIRIQAFYLPYAFMCISMLLGQPIMEDIIGLAVGHAYYFLADVYPLQSGRQVIQTPAILKNWLADIGIRGHFHHLVKCNDQARPEASRAFKAKGGDYRIELIECLGTRPCNFIMCTNLSIPFFPMLSSVHDTVHMLELMCKLCLVLVQHASYITGVVCGCVNQRWTVLNKA